MKVLIFGATGMVGAGVLRECLNAADVSLIQTIGRTATGQRHDKLREVVHPDLWNYAPIEAALSDFDVCFFCLGVSSSGMKEPAYRRVTYDLTLAAARALAPRNPNMTFAYVSGAGTDSSEKGRLMWARVKGETENALRRLPFKAVYLFRPGLIQPLDGVPSKTRWYRVAYAVIGPFLPVARSLFPRYVLTTRQIGQAMLTVARRGWPQPILEPGDIYRAAAADLVN
jgi:uncharacterized protein YbjT (DUF2867 family)